MEERNRKKTRKTWVAVLLGAVAAAALFGLLWATYDPFVPEYAAENPQIASGIELPPGQGLMYDPSNPVDQLIYNEGILVPVGQPRELPEQHVGVVGQTEEGYLLYGYFPEGVDVDKPRWPTGGGGGAGPEAVPQAEAGVFLRTLDGRYVLLTQVGTTRGARNVRE